MEVLRFEVDYSDNEESEAAPAGMPWKAGAGIDPSEYGRMPASYYDSSQTCGPSEANERRRRSRGR